jgi:hypothetical protein
MFRWKIPESHVLGYSIGNSDSLLVNYIHLLGFTDSPDVSTQVWLNEKENKPIMNVASIQRDGLRPQPYPTNIPLLQAAVQAAEAGFRDFNFFRALCADLMFDQHTKMSGTFTCVGIQDPISIGDNFEMISDDPNAQKLLFHISGITHEGGIYGNGEKTFRTTLHVSYGSVLNNKDIADSAGQTWDIKEAMVNGVRLQPTKTNLPQRVTSSGEAPSINFAPLGDESVGSAYTQPITGGSRARAAEFNIVKK